MVPTPIHVIDLNFLNRSQAIGVYLMLYSGGAVLIDCGAGSTRADLEAGLAVHNLTPRNVTHVLLTHIHLDHAGAAGWLANQGAQIYVHPAGAPHLLNPEKLLASAKRLYGEAMDRLWGEFVPVPPERLIEVQDGAEIAVGPLCFTALHTPGHAKHHTAYFLEDIAFGGDVGVRLPGPLYLRLPFVPPETHLEDWRESLMRMRQVGSKRLALTHFGVYDDADAHLTLALRLLAETECWLEEVMPESPPLEIFRERYVAWLLQQGRAMKLGEEFLQIYGEASPAQISADGLYRYWQKVRLVA